MLERLNELKSPTFVFLATLRVPYILAIPRTHRLLLQCLHRQLQHIRISPNLDHRYLDSQKQQPILVHLQSNILYSFVNKLRQIEFNMSNPLALLSLHISTVFLHFQFRPFWHVHFLIFLCCVLELGVSGECALLYFSWEIIDFVFLMSHQADGLHVFLGCLGFTEQICGAPAASSWGLATCLGTMATSESVFWALFSHLLASTIFL